MSMINTAIAIIAALSCVALVFTAFALLGSFIRAVALLDRLVTMVEQHFATDADARATINRMSEQGARLQTMCDDLDNAIDAMKQQQLQQQHRALPLTHTNKTH